MKKMQKCTWAICLSLCLSVLVVSGCCTTAHQGAATEAAPAPATLVASGVPAWMGAPEADGKITAVGYASPSTIPEVGKARAENDLFNKLARAISVNVAVRLKDLVEDHPVLNDPQLSYSHMFFQKVSDQITRKQLNAPFLKEIWVDADGKCGVAGMIYAYGWIGDPCVASNALREASALLKVQAMRTDLSEKAKADLEQLIIEMNAEADKLE